MFIQQCENLKHKKILDIWCWKTWITSSTLRS